MTATTQQTLRDAVDYALEERFSWWRIEVGSCSRAQLVDDLLAGPIAAHIASVEAERDAADDLAYRLKYAAAGGEDVPMSANAVTVEDVDRWRREAEACACTAEAEVARLTAALKPFVAHYEPWMDEYQGDEHMGTYARVTFRQFHAARSALQPTEASHG